MSSKIVFDGTEHDVSKLTAGAKAQMSLLNFSETRLEELQNMLVLLQKAKNGYIAELKREVLSQKAGFTLDE